MGEYQPSGMWSVRSDQGEVLPGVCHTQATLLRLG
jgi:hypothetical protein